MLPQRTRVLYIAGTGRSGSTVLANILGEVAGLVSAGELRFVWERGIVENRLCGCGERFAACSRWREVLITAYGEPDAVDAAAMARWQRGRSRMRHLPRLFAARFGHDVLDRRHGDHADRLARLIAAVSACAGGAVVVDSSKLPAYGFLLAQLPSIDLHVVHLVRDPRAAAYSWMRRKEQPDRGYSADMQTIGPLKSSALWTVWNASAQAMWRHGDGHYLRVRYEDFAARPREVVEEILSMLGMAGASLPFIDERTVSLGVNHTVAGNPDRLRHGVTRLERDGAWAARLRGRDRLLVSAVTAPLLLRYGYPLRPRVAAAGETPDRWVSVQDLPSATRLMRRVGRHLHWARQQGLRQLIEEDQLDPVLRLRGGLRRRAWRRHNHVAPGTAVPVYLVGVQRSGTNMVTRGLEASPEFEVYNENDRRAFERYRLRSDDVIRSLVTDSRHRYVLFKPLCDSHRVDHLLDAVKAARAPLAVWAFRSVDGRVRSALAKFGDNNLRVLGEIAAGRADGMWQAQRISDDTLDLVRGLDRRRTSPETAAALFWYLRNVLYFEMGLDLRDDVTLVCYDELVRDPEPQMRALCSFLGCGYAPELIAHIAPRRDALRRPLDLDPVVRARCTELEQRLRTAAAGTTARLPKTMTAGSRG